jgi:hypothetical protein
MNMLVVRRRTPRKEREYVGDEKEGQGEECEE